MTGKTCGRLTVLRRSDPAKHKYRRAYWECSCSCGGAKTASSGDLLAGKVGSCGCLKREHLRRVGPKWSPHSKRNRGPIQGPRFQYTHERLHGVWVGMIKRCTDVKSKDYPSYGGRGISVHPRWRKYMEFRYDVWDLYKPGLHIERINNNGNYEPGNVKWATRSEQARNRRSNRIIEFNGQKRPLIEWCVMFGVERWQRVQMRLDMGWSASDAFFAPKVRGSTKNPRGHDYRRRRAA